MVFLKYQKKMLELVNKESYPLMLHSSLNAALGDDDAAIRVLNNNIDENGTGNYSPHLI